MNSVIYTLVHPITKEIRYCGGTKRKPSERLYGHIHYAKTSLSTHHCSNWIKSLLDIGLKPELVVIEQLDSDNYFECEKKWIAHFKANGVKLTNSTNGGEGLLGYKPSKESINKWKSTNLIIREIKNYYKYNRY